MVIAFPFLAKLSADRQPVAPRAAVVLPPLPDPPPPDARLQRLPAGLRSDGDVESAAVALLGQAGAQRFLAQVRAVTSRAGNWYMFPEFERFVPARVDPVAATDLGARLIDSGTGPSEAIGAFVLFEHAIRSGGGCAPALNLLLLHAAEAPDIDYDRTVAAGRRAIAACGSDPTAGWLLGQVESMFAPRTGLRRLRALRVTYPGSAAAWSGEADAILRLAYITPPEQAFLRRHRFERARVGYERAARLSGARGELDLGLARALAGLNRPDDAVSHQRAAIAATPRTGVAQARLVEYLESAHRFPAAAVAAAQLSDVGAAEPAGPGLFPRLNPEYLPRHELQDEEAHMALSLGAATLRPVRVFLGETKTTLPQVDVEDLSFIPVFREGPGVGSQRWCADWSRRRDLLLAGRPAAAASGLPQGGFVDVSGDGCGEDVAVLAGLAALEAGDRRAARASGYSLDSLQEARQNLWRWAGDLRRAERAARDWADGSQRVLPLLRLGEIEFLQRRFDLAARHFDAAARRARRSGQPTTSWADALLKRGAALVAAGRADEGIPVLREADQLAARVPGARYDDVTLSRSYYALSQLGDAMRARGELKAAADAYAAARRLPTVPASVGHLANNSAIVETGLGNPDRGLRLSRKALAVDPANPAYLMTAAFAAHRAGHDHSALALNQRALWIDPTAYPAANDAGVLLARAGRDQAAVAALRRAVGANERYALGWFNLGVVLSDMGLRRLPASQGALAQAFALDPALRDRKREPTIDARTYRSGVDVSRPLPGEWTFAASQRRAPEKTVGLVATLLLAFGLARTLGSARSGRGLADTWLGRLADATARVRLPGPLRHPLVAILATLAALLWPLARDPGGGVTAAVAGALGVLVLVAVALRARAAVARRAGEPGGQESWAPGVAFGVGTAAAGFTWAPLPVLREASARLHWAAPVALACVALPLVVMTAWLDIPLTRTLAAAALVMAASLLTPVKPVDGGAISAAGGVAAGLTGLGLAVLLLLGLV